MHNSDADENALFRTLIRLRQSPAHMMHRHLVVHVIAHLPCASELNDLSASIHERLTHLPVQRLSSTACVLEVAGNVLMTRRAAQAPRQRVSLSLMEMQRQLNTALQELPLVHAAALRASQHHGLTPSVAALLLGLSAPLIRRYAVQARALIRCHRWTTPAVLT